MSTAKLTSQRRSNGTGRPSRDGSSFGSGFESKGGGDRSQTAANSSNSFTKVSSEIDLDSERWRPAFELPETQQFGLLLALLYQYCAAHDSVLIICGSYLMMKDVIVTLNMVYLVPGLDTCELIVDENAHAPREPITPLPQKVDWRDHYEAPLSLRRRMQRFHKLADFRVVAEKGVK